MGPHRKEAQALGRGPPRSLDLGPTSSNNTGVTTLGVALSLTVPEVSWEPSEGARTGLGGRDSRQREPQRHRTRVPASPASPLQGRRGPPAALSSM